MKIINTLIAYSKALFKLNVLTFDLFDILFATSHLNNFPINENDDPYELENYGFMEITDNKIIFYCGNDWQPPVEVTVELIGNKPVITHHRIIDNFSEYVKNQLPEELVYDLFGLAKL